MKNNMRHLKNYNSFKPINEEEEILGRFTAGFGAFNDDAVEMAEEKLKNPKSGFRPSSKGILDFKLKEFNKFKKAWKEGDKESESIFKQIVKHINTNDDAIYSVIEEGGKKTFRAGSRYGREGGTGAGAGGGS
jgi:hypothetical protein